MTGGDLIRAHYMHRDSVEFPFTALLVLAGNDKPSLKSVDPGIVRRLHLIPFENQIDDEHEIKGFKDKLVAAEGGAILAWMLEGCQRVQAEGLAPPSRDDGHR